MKTKTKPKTKPQTLEQIIARLQMAKFSIQNHASHMGFTEESRWIMRRCQELQSGINDLKHIDSQQKKAEKLRSQRAYGKSSSTTTSA